jgi:shikimate 5-dehydrogenase
VIGAGGASTAMAVQGALDRHREDLHVQPQGPLLRVGVDHGRRDQRTYRHRQDDERLRGPELIQSRGDGVVTLGQCHGVGTNPLERISPLPDTWVLRDDLFVSGGAYAPMKSRFLKQAEAAGCRFINGLPMIYHQGATSFKLFAGQDMPLNYVREHMFE